MTSPTNYYAEARAFMCRRHVDVVALATTLIVFGPGVLRYIGVAFSPDQANDDSRQVTWPLFRYHDPELFSSDPIADYYFYSHMPIGYHAVIGGLAHLFLPTTLLAVVGLLSMLIIGIFAVLIGRVVGGAVGGWIGLALVLACDYWLSWTAGGLPRATGYALTFIAVYGFCSGRAAYAAVATLLGALFWYSAAVCAGALFAIQFLAPEKLLGWKHTRPLPHRLAIVALIGCLAVGFIAPKALLPSGYGAVISAASSEWPEAGPGGRFSPMTQLGIGDPWRVLAFGSRAAFVSSENPWLDDNIPRKAKSRAATALSVFLCVALVVLCWTSIPARRLLAIGAVSGLLFVTAILLAPLLYAPSRYIFTLLPVLGTGTLVYVTANMGTWLSQKLTWITRQRFQVLSAALVIFLLGGRPSEQGYNIKPTPAEKSAIEFVSGLPKNVLIAGWPGGIIENVTLFARRRVLMSYETHLPYHEVYARDMRHKMHAIIDAWFSTDTQGLEALSKNYGVTHFVIDKKMRDDNSLTYFRPFDEYILKMREASSGKNRWVNSPDPESIVLETTEFVIIRLDWRE